MEKENAEADLKPLPEWIDLTPEQKDAVVWGLFNWIANGDAAHRMWLFQAVYTYFNRGNRPHAT